MSPRSFLSIGEVLKQLQPEFPEVSISKIRFLETEGLIEPERTASGYRKYFEPDVARLKYILTLQRDQFLPLKVIRRKLETFDPDAPEQAGQSAQNGPATPAPPPQDEELFTLDGGLNLSFDELTSQSGLESEELRELEEFGLIDSHRLGSGDVYYDEDDLIVAKICRDFGKFGLEPRHLKMYSQFADKEAGMFDQILAPMARSANPDAKRGAGQSINELARLSKRIKHLLLRARLKDHLRA
ncbi:MAG TPA: MerR family transcriptional regulator [Actinomycetota bacterium]|nr:MerR family transcriptional regulator [Actinomycetota bacterium]